MSELTRQLQSARNPDGGWPYYPGKASRLEPTAWALLALQASGEPVSADPFAAWPRRDGWFLDRTTDDVNVGFNAIVAVALVALGAPRAMTDPLARALVASKGERLPQSDSNAQDNSLQGWSWVTGTFSWVEPTALGLLALKRLRATSQESQARIAEAERLLLDRVCTVGGWNYGNANVLGKALEPYIATSALGLIALRNIRTDERVARSLQYLSSQRLSERAAISLALTRVALGLYGVPADDVQGALDGEWSRSASIGSVHGVALALYATAGAGRGYEALGV